MSEPLTELARELRSEETPIAPHVVDSPDGGIDASEVVEAVREGYLLHYDEPRLLAGHDEDLALLAGDYLYALGIRRLAAKGDCAAVLRLADLISGCAAAHAEGREEQAAALWEAASQ